MNASDVAADHQEIVQHLATLAASLCVKSAALRAVSVGLLTASAQTPHWAKLLTDVQQQAASYVATQQFTGTQNDAEAMRHIVSAEVADLVAEAARLLTNAEPAASVAVN